MKTIKQYMAKGKVPNKARISMILQNTTGCIPSEISYEELIKMFDSEQKKYNDLKLAKSAEEDPQEDRRSLARAAWRNSVACSRV